MSLLPLSIQPGLYTEATPRTALNRWKDGLNVRFFKTNPEKIGGWTAQITTPFLGVCRAMMAWTTLSFARYAALGTNIKLYLTDSVNYFDITPLASTGTLGANPFTTTNASTTVTVHDVAHGESVGGHVHFSGATAVGGLTLNGEYVISTIVDADNYQITAPSAATSGATGGGSSVVFQYEIAVGNVDSILGMGWGMGGWGIGTWGTSRTSGFLQVARIWSLVKYGEDLIASPLDNPMYIWDPTTGTNSRAVLITNAPIQNRRVLLAKQLRIVLSLGSHDGTDPDPMLIRWSDTEDYTDWTPDITNLAGDLRLDDGNEIIGGLTSRDEVVAITDTTLYSLTMTGDDLVFAAASKGQTSGLVGPNAAVDVNGTVYCMGRGSFYTYDGTVNELQCDVHGRVFGTPEFPGINYTQAAKTYATWNPLKSEVIWFFCSANATEVDSCVGISTVDKSWWLGTMKRTAWLSKHPFTDQFNVPLATDTVTSQAGATTGTLYLQETGVDANGAALPYFLESYDQEISASSNLITGAVTGAGEFVFRVKRLIPDLVRIAGAHVAYIKGRKYPNGKQRVKGPIAFNATTLHIDGHVRGRQIAIRIESDKLGADISVGGWRVDGSEEGSR